MSQVSWSKRNFFIKSETKVAKNVAVEKLPETEDNLKKLKEKAGQDGVPSAIVKMGGDVLLLSGAELVTDSPKGLVDYPSIKKDGVVEVDGQEGEVLHVDDGFSEIDASAVTVAIVDSGVDVEHPALQGRIVSPFNVTKGNDDVMDGRWHGTHVAGIACGDAVIEGMPIGVAPKAKIMPVKISSDNALITPTYIADGIRYAADHGAKVINLSLILSPEGVKDPKYITEVQRAVEYAQSKGALVIAGAGNDNSNVPQYPASFPGVLSVGALDKNLKSRASFSNYGPRLDVVAPGVDIASSTPGGLYVRMTGTSMATPYLSGVAALVFARHPDWTPEQVLAQLKWAVTDLGNPGRDDEFGYGRIDTFKAVYGVKDAPSGPSVEKP